MPTGKTKSKNNSSLPRPTDLNPSSTLPKITSSSRNNNNSILNKSMNSGDGDDEYEQDFEYDDQNKMPKSRSMPGRNLRAKPNI